MCTLELQCTEKFPFKGCAHSEVRALRIRPFKRARSKLRLRTHSSHLFESQTQVAIKSTFHEFASRIIFWNRIIDVERHDARCFLLSLLELLHVSTYSNLRLLDIQDFLCISASFRCLKLLRAPKRNARTNSSKSCASTQSHVPL